MEGITRWPGSRAAEHMRTHPGTVICCIRGIWHAWVPSGDGRAGAEAHAPDEDELIAKLGG